MYDTIIIGGGPAGLTAAIYTARKKLRTLLLTKEIGGQMVWSSDVENYSGFSFITGADLTLKFREHLESVKEDLEIKEAVEVAELARNITSFEVTDTSGTSYYGRSIVIATGKQPRHLGIPGEQQFYGHGVAVCATCDAPLYKGRDVAVVGGGNSAMDALLALSKVARRVYSINVNKELAGDEVLKAKIYNALNIQFFSDTVAVEIRGDQSVMGIVVQPTGGAAQTLAVSGVFVEIGYMTANDFDRLTEKNEVGEIIVNQNLETSVPGIFAPGDCNSAHGGQIIIAAGEGAKAALAVNNYLNMLK